MWRVQLACHFTPRLWPAGIFVRKTKEMSGEGSTADGLMPEAREHLERIVIEIVGIAECENSSATQQKLMQLVEQISTILDE